MRHKGLVIRLPPLRWVGSALPFEARRYLEDYFRETGSEYEALYQYWCGSLARAAPRSGGLRALELGVGPAIYSTLCLAPYCAEVHLADYIPACLDEIARWLRCEEGHFDWTPHVRLVLTVEGVEPTDQAVADRERALRQRVTRLLPCDLRRADPVGVDAPPYDVVTAHYCVEMAPSNPAEWSAVLARVARLVRPGGLLLVSSAVDLRLRRVFQEGEAPHVAASVTIEEAQAALTTAGMDPARTDLRVLPAPPDRPYAATLLIAATRYGQPG